MKSQTRITQILKKNMKNVTIFNYNKKVVKTVTEVKQQINNKSIEYQNNILSTISETLHEYLNGIYEEALNDKESWNNYFKSILTTSTTIEINTERDEGGTNEPELQETN